MEYRTRWFDDTGRWEDVGDNVRKRMFRDRETGAETTRLPVGALFFPLPGMYAHGSLVCIIPCSSGTHWWCIDHRASNCTMPDDNEHRCWVRHGEDGDVIHVDKNGTTCAAGAGSIMVDGFHGFLHHGVLRDC
jgi:hypothetical protein